MKVTTAGCIAIIFSFLMLTSGCVTEDAIRLTDKILPISNNENNQEDSSSEPVEHTTEKAGQSSEKKTDPPAEPLSAEELEQLTREIQTELTRRGFKPGKIDGKTGSNTRNAICYYQLTHSLPLNPKISRELLNSIEQAPGSGVPVTYNEIAKQRCKIAHINNLSNIDTIELHSYEGALAPDDLLCKQVVSPFNISSNMTSLVSSFTDNLKQLFNGTENKIDLDELKEDAKKLNWLPIAAEIKYGKALHKKQLEHKEILDRNLKRRDVRRFYKKGDKLLAEILESIEQEYPYEFKLFVVDDRALNAEAIPGGYLYINSGVLKTNYAKLIMSHEIAHVLRRHTTRELQSKLIDSVEAGRDLKKLISSGSKAPDEFIEKILTLRGAIIQYSQQQELQADACSVRISYSSETSDQMLVHINSYISGIEKSHPKKAKKKDAKINEPVSTHPACIHREKRMISVYDDCIGH